MKRILICIGLLFFPVGYTWAQQSIGFSNPRGIQQLLNYRLPSWGYSKLVLDFNSGGQINDYSDKASTPQEAHRQRFNFEADPSYDLYKESEKQILALNSMARFIYSHDKRGNQLAADDKLSSTIHSSISLRGDMREYVHSKIFLLLSEQADFNYTYHAVETNDNLYHYDRHFKSTTELGLGFGRVRNVTPVVRAIRLNERYKAINDSKRLTPREIRLAADQFTRYQGYKRRYDRPEKYFWHGMDRAVNNKIGALSSFDLFYLTDVLDETLGSRLEGWDVTAGGSFGFISSMVRDESTITTTNRSLDNVRLPGAFAGARWYKNISLRHQLSVTLDARRTYMIDSNDKKWGTDITASFMWLWNVADRYLLKTRLMNYSSFDKFENNFLRDRIGWQNNAVLSSNIIYFIENKVALDAGLSYQLTYQGDSIDNFEFEQRTSSLVFNAGIRYYFSRNLY